MGVSGGFRVGAIKPKSHPCNFIAQLKIVRTTNTTILAVSDTFFAPTDKSQKAI